MASITKKKISGRIYYYARESKRIDGKPRIIWQKYLGKINDLIQAVENKDKPNEPDQVVVSRFGAVAALYDLSQQWDMAKIIDEAVGKRDQGLSIGNYMLIAAINRCVCPKSKRQIGEWFFDTPLRRWIPTKKSYLDSKRFWDNMALLDAKTISRAEQALTRSLIQRFNIDTRCLLYDTTNFITFIDSFNEKGNLAQRGKSKQGRRDLRIVGLALLVSTDFHIPLMHETYKGNSHDSVQFDSIVDRLVERYKVLSTATHGITLVFDKGNNSKDNMEKLYGTDYHFVGSLKLNEMNDLLDIPLEEYETIENSSLHGIRSYRATKNVFGQKQTVLITYNEELFLTQSQCILREIRKRTTRLKTLAIQLSKWQDGLLKKGKKPTAGGVESKVRDILKGQYMKQIIHTEVTEKNGIPLLTYSVNHNSFTQISNQRLGKTILFTDNDSWNNEEIILAYRGQFQVEDAFKTMKNPHFVSWSPMWHWTDHNIRVHAFYCVLALSLASLLRRKLYHSGIDVSIAEAVDKLSEINEVALVKTTTPGRGKTAKPRIVLSKMKPEQQKMFAALDLVRYTKAKI